MPGVVLQPLNLGELLDRMFSLYRKNFLLFFGIMLLPSLLAMASGILMAVFRSPMVAPASGAAKVNPVIIGSAVGGFVVAMVAYWIVYAVALGASTFAVSDVYLGRAATIRLPIAASAGASGGYSGSCSWFPCGCSGCLCC